MQNHYNIENLNKKWIFMNTYLLCTIYIGITKH